MCFNCILAIEDMNNSHCLNLIVWIVILMLEDKHDLGVGGIDRVRNCHLIFNFFRFILAKYYINWLILFIFDIILPIVGKWTKCDQRGNFSRITVKSREVGISRVRWQFPKNGGFQIRSYAGIIIAFFYLVESVKLEKFI